MSFCSGWSMQGGSGRAVGYRMWFSALGTIGMREAGRPVDIGPARRRAILAVLLVHLGHPVSPDGLIDRVWVNHLRPARAV